MKDGKGEVHEFMGMWPLKPDADLVKFTKTLAFREFWNPPGRRSRRRRRCSG